MELGAKNLDRPDDRPELPKMHADLVQVGDYVVVRGTLEPGWRWSNDVRPILGGTSCQVPHTGVTVSGRWHFEMDDGASLDLGAGDVYSSPAGHDAWVVGDEPVQTIDWGTIDNEARNRMMDAGKEHAGT
jgi:hypothetical protein